MIRYLSYGGGVNSTALLLILQDEGVEFETIFVNHGGDRPETYEYLGYLKSLGFQITEIIPNIEGHSSLYDYCIDKKIIPMRQLRWCTGKFKIIPIKNYIETPSIQYVGIGYDERHRIEGWRGIKGSEYRFPLIKREISRQRCIRIIEDHGLRVPRKSGCFFCPFMRKGEARELFLEHPEFYEKVKFLEQNCSREDLYLMKKPFQDMAKETVPDILSYGGI